MTVTVWLQVAVLPLLSVTVHVTVVVPFWKIDGASFVVDDTWQLSDVDGVPSVTFDAVHWPGSVLTDTACGHVI